VGSFDRFVWSFVGGEPRQNAWRSLKEVPALTPESDALSKALRQRGFTFVGSTICYAFMQAAGLVNDHLVDCFRHLELRGQTSPSGQLSGRRGREARSVPTAKSDPLSRRERP
jgi:3-methyladenine DNA glycosylase Tag